MILSSFLTALGQFDDPRFRRAVGLGVALALALLVALYAAVLVLVQVLTPDSFTLPWIGEVGGLSTMASFASLAAMLLLSVFLMVPVASAFTGFFLDGVADAVEARHYPTLPPAHQPSLWAALIDSVRYFGVLVLLNLIGVAIALFTGGIGLVILWGINGYLLSREYFTMIALRRMNPADAHAMRRANGFQLWVAGTLMAIPLSVPLVNLVMPVIGAATFTHLFHRIALR